MITTKRMMGKRTLSLILAAVFAMSALSACGKSTKEEQCLELVNSPSTTLDNVWYNPGGIFRCAIFESLLNTNADMKQIEPALAKKYEISEDGLVYTFELRKDVKWHDGESLDAEDVLFSFKSALRSSEINGLISSAFHYIEGAEEYSNGESEEVTGILIDGNRIEIRLIQQVGSFLGAIAQFAILPQHLLGDIEPDLLPESEYWMRPVGCGAYRIIEAADEYFILEANKEYYGKKPGISKMRIRQNVENCVEEIQNRQLDFYVTNDPEEIAKLNGVEACKAYDLNILFPTYLILNLSEDEGVNEDLKNVRVRKALLLAIDRDTITDAVFPGSSVTNTLIPSWDSWYWEGAEDYKYNPDRAKELLEEAGFDFTKTLRLRYSVKGQATEDMMNAIAVYWRAIGLNVDVQKFEGSGSEHMFNIRDFDVCYKRLSAFNHASVYEEIYGDGVMQTSLYNQPVYDECIDELGRVMDEEARKEIVEQMQSLDQEHLLRLPLFALANIAYINEEQFVIPDVFGNLWYRYDLRFEEWELKK